MWQKGSLPQERLESKSCLLEVARYGKMIPDKWKQSIIAHIFMKKDSRCATITVVSA